MGLLDKSRLRNIDWVLVGCYILLIFIGWINIYASIHSTEVTSIFDPSGRSGKQFIWMAGSIISAALIITVIDPRIYERISLPVYIFTILLLIAVIFLGTEVKGSRSWFELGPARFQPAEISKISTSLLLATIMSQFGFKISKPKDFIIVASVIIVPMLIIVAQSETGSALVYVGFIFVLYREGLSGWLIFLIGMFIALFIVTLTVSSYAAILTLAVIVSMCNSGYTGEMRRWWTVYLPVFAVLAGFPFLHRYLCSIDSLAPLVSGIDPLYILLGVCLASIPFILFKAYRKRSGFTPLAAAAFIAGVLLSFSTEFIFENVLQDHQRQRIEVLLGMKEDPTGVGYNVNQSMIAIGSGGLTGKGFLHGTQTTYGFVPEQSTDFIFCTIGEEWGFIGSAFVLMIYLFLIGRIIVTAEKSREAFTRIYGYCVASCIFMHLFINIGMTMGLMPVIGIPLPFISYGGSSLVAFTVLLFIFIALRSNENHNFS